ncbi:MAG TPA: VWA domain-containing protein, partial [Pyrinomonadaceae bacterium]|nr:VWA domain-containing protein [Pyrinomonadaceae bacterium]
MLVLFRKSCGWHHGWIRHVLLRAAVVLLTAHCSLLTVQAQTPEPTDTIRIDTDLVNVSVSVFSRQVSLPKSALEQKDFAVFENGEPQEISFFASAETPFDLVLLLDLSGSTADKIKLIRTSSKRFVDAARPGDRIAIVTFTADVQVVSRLTLDHEALKTGVDQIAKPRGGTNFWDALRFVLEHIVGQSRVEGRRSAVVVMTDGVDNALPDVFGDGSVTTFTELVDIVRSSDTIVLPIYLDTVREGRHNGTPVSAYVLAQQQLSELASESGNAVYQARRVEDLNGAYAQVIRDLSTVYSIGYRPANRVRDGSWRAVAVQLVGRPD